MWSSDDEDKPLIVKQMKSGAKRHWSTFNHLFQLSSSSSLSITGTVRVRRQLAGYWEREREKERKRGREGGRGEMNINYSQLGLT